MPQHHQLTIVLGKHLSGQVDRLLDVLEEKAFDTSKLNRALDRSERVTDRLEDTIQQNQP